MFAWQQIFEPSSEILRFIKKKNPRFFWRPLESTGLSQNIAEVNIMMNENNASINLYAQLTLVVKLRTKRSRPQLSAGAARAP